MGIFSSKPEEDSDPLEASDSEDDGCDEESTEPAQPAMEGVQAPASVWECTGKCAYRDDLNLQDRMLLYEHTPFNTKKPLLRCPTAVRLVVHSTALFSNAVLAKPDLVPRLAAALQCRFYPTAVFVSPREVCLLYMHGGCPYMPHTSRVGSHMASFLTCWLTQQLNAASLEVSAHVAVFGDATADIPGCACWQWEAYNYLVARGMQANHAAVRALAAAWLPAERLQETCMRALKEELQAVQPASHAVEHGGFVLPPFSALERWQRHGAVFRFGLPVPGLPARWWKSRKWARPDWLLAPRDRPVREPNALHPDPPPAADNACNPSESSDTDDPDHTPGLSDTEDDEQVRAAGQATGAAADCWGDRCAGMLGTTCCAPASDLSQSIMRLRNGGGTGLRGM